MTCNLITCHHVWMITQILSVFFPCKYQINGSFLSFCLSFLPFCLWRTWTDLGSAGSWSLSSSIIAAVHTFSPSILFAHTHVILGAPSFTICLHSLVSWIPVHGRRDNPYHRFQHHCANLHLLNFLKSDMIRFSCIDGVAAQNAENGAGDSKA